MTDYVALKAELTSLLNAAAQSGADVELTKDYDFPIGQGHRWGPKSTSPKDPLTGAPLPFGSRDPEKPITIRGNGHVLGDLYWGKIRGVHFLETIHRGPVRIDGGDDITFERITSTSPGKQIGINAGSNLKVVRSRLIGGDTAIAIGGVDGVEIAQNQISGVLIDGFFGASVWNVLIEWNAFFDSRPGFDPVSGEPVHPDAAQFMSQLGARPCANVTVRKNTVHGRTQGFFFGDKARGGYDNVEVSDNQIEGSYGQAICFEGVRKGRILRNKVTTYDVPGAKQANINILRSTDIQVAGNTIGPGAGKKGRSDPDVGLGTPAWPDQRARVAELEAVSASAAADAAKLRTALQEQNARLGQIAALAAP